MLFPEMFLHGLTGTEDEMWDELKHGEEPSRDQNNPQYKEWKKSSNLSLIAL